MRAVIVSIVVLYPDAMCRLGFSRRDKCQVARRSALTSHVSEGEACSILCKRMSAERFTHPFSCASAVELSIDHWAMIATAAVVTACVRALHGLLAARCEASAGPTRCSANRSRTWPVAHAAVRVAGAVLSLPHPVQARIEPHALKHWSWARKS